MPDIIKGGLMFMNKLALTLTTEYSEDAPFLFSGDIRDGVQYAGQTGYDCVEIHVPHPRELHIERLKDALHSADITVSALGTGRAYVRDGLSLSSSVLSVRRDAVNRLKAFIDAAAELDSLVIVGCMRGNVSGTQSLSSVLELLRLSMQEVDAYAARAGITLVFEPINRYENNFLCTADSIVSFIRDNSLTATKLMLDTFHMNIEEQNIEDTILRTSAYTSYFHFADSNRLAPGNGHIDFKKIVACLKKVHYNGVISAECLPLPTEKAASKQWLSAVKELLK